MENLLFPELDSRDHDLYDFLSIPNPLSVTDDFCEPSNAQQENNMFLPPLMVDLDHWADIEPSNDIDLTLFPERVNNINPSSPENNPSSPSSSASPCSPPATYHPQMTIKKEPLSPSDHPIRKRQRTNKTKSVAGKLKNNSDSYFDSGYSSEEAEFDPNAMPHPSIFTKSPSQLSKEELLSLTSRGLEEYERRLKTFHTLTHAEQNLLKRQRRLVKNRESAQQSRMRKKVYVQELEHKVSHLLNERDELSRLNQELANKNEMLQNQLNLLQQSMGSHSVDLLPITKPSFIKREPQSLRAPQAAGVCALVMVFSFALFFTLQTSPTSSVVSLAPTPESSPAWHTGRLLHEFNSTSPVHSSSPQPSSPFSERESASFSDIDSPHSPMIDITSLDSDDESSSPPSTLSPPYSASPVVVSRSFEKDPIPDGSALVIKRESTDLEHPLFAPSYIYCAEAQQLIPVTAKDLNTPNTDLPLISLLLPASALDTTLLRLVEPVRSNQLMELSCQVRSIEVFPLSMNGNDFLPALSA